MPDHSIEIIPDASAPVYPKHATPLSDDQSIWATEDDYLVRNNDPSSDFISNPAKDGMDQPSQPESRAVSEYQEDYTCSTSRKSVSIGRMFFKTKLCSRLRSGTCPHVKNCSFAHGMEELRRTPTNWPEIDGRREEHRIPILTSSAGMMDWQRSYKGKHCKKFYTAEGCPYGDMCSFLHDEQLKDRESVAINLSPTVGAGGFGDRGYGAGGNGSVQKHSSWKTRICNKWEMTGYCPFGTKCHFAHGAAELHSHGGRVVEMETNDTSSSAPAASIKAATAAISSTTSLPHADAHHVGVPAQRSNTINPRPIQRPIQKWKGPDKISRIYGDWIDDID